MLKPDLRRGGDSPREVRQRPPRLLADHGAAGLRRSLSLLALVVLGGTVGYMLIEGWNAWDGPSSTPSHS